MSRIIEDYQPKKGGRRDTYPWTEWLDGRTYMLSRGEDFKCTLKAMRIHIYRMAKRRGVKVSVHFQDKNTIVLEVVKPPAKAKTKGVIRFPAEKNPVPVLPSGNPYKDAPPPARKPPKRKKLRGKAADELDRATVLHVDEDGHATTPKTRRPKNPDSLLAKTDDLKPSILRKAIKP